MRISYLINFGISLMRVCFDKVWGDGEGLRTSEGGWGTEHMEQRILYMIVNDALLKIYYTLISCDIFLTKWLRSDAAHLVRKMDVQPNHPGSSLYGQFNFLLFQNHELHYLFCRYGTACPITLNAASVCNRSLDNLIRNKLAKEHKIIINQWQSVDP
jgi:hypothetical protein